MPATLATEVRDLLLEVDWIIYANQATNHLYILPLTQRAKDVAKTWTIKDKNIDKTYGIQCLDWRAIETDVDKLKHQILNHIKITCKQSHQIRIQWI